MEKYGKRKKSCVCECCFQKQETSVWEMKSVQRNKEGAGKKVKHCQWNRRTSQTFPQKSQSNQHRNREVKNKGFISKREARQRFPERKNSVINTSGVRNDGNHYHQAVWLHFCHFSLYMWRALAGPKCQSYLFLRSSSVVFLPVRQILPHLWLLYAASKAQKAEENCQLCPQNAVLLWYCHHISLSPVIHSENLS